MQSQRNNNRVYSLKQIKEAYEKQWPDESTEKVHEMQEQ